MQALLGLVGNKLSHSLSQVYFREKFRSLGLTNADYLLFELESIGELPTLLQQHNALVGFNVTIPFKQDVIKYLDDIDDVAKEAGAVNTVLIDKGNLKGFNTDVVGFEQTLLPLLKRFHQPVKALVLGAGGSAKAVAFVLRKQGIPFAVVSRRLHHGDLTYEELTDATIQNHLLIVNSTPLGMQPNVASFPDLPYEAVTPNHVLIDLVYNPLETQFLKFGGAKQATCVNGLSMLYAQADAAWEIWKHRFVQRQPG